MVKNIVCTSEEGRDIRQSRKRYTIGIRLLHIVIDPDYITLYMKKY